MQPLQLKVPGLAELRQQLAGVAHNQVAEVSQEGGKDIEILAEAEDPVPLGRDALMPDVFLERLAAGFIAFSKNLKDIEALIDTLRSRPIPEEEVPSLLEMVVGFRDSMCAQLSTVEDGLKLAQADLRRYQARRRQVGSTEHQAFLAEASDCVNQMKMGARKLADLIAELDVWKQSLIPASKVKPQSSGRHSLLRLKAV